MKLFSQLVRTAVNIATLPVAVLEDVVTLGGCANGKDEPYTVRALKQLKEEAKEEA